MKKSELQNQIIEILLKEGYIKKYDNSETYEKSGHLPINVKRISSLHELIRTIYDCGKTDKMWEIQRVLQITP